MGNLETIEQVLDFAIEREDEACAFYAAWADKAADSALKPVFLGLAEQERQHKEKLSAIRKGHTVFRFKDDLFPKIHLLDFVVEARLEPDLTLEDALALAMQREKVSYRLYLELAAGAEEESLGEVFVSLAHEEANHRVRLEIEYDRVISET
jgi:rubrerythrin